MAQCRGHPGRPLCPPRRPPPGLLPRAAHTLRPLVPGRPDRPRLLRRFAPPHAGPDRLLAAPAGLGGGESDGIALRPPLRAGRRAQPSGRQGQSPPRWRGGGTLGLRLTPLGVVGAWAWAGATAPDPAFPPLREEVAGQRSVVSEDGFPAQAGEPPKLKLCHRGPWTTRLLVETGRSRLTGVCQLKKVRPRGWAYCQARRAFTRAAVKVLGHWQGLEPDPQGLIRLSLAEFSL